FGLPSSEYIVGGASTEEGADELRGRFLTHLENTVEDTTTYTYELTEAFDSDTPTDYEGRGVFDAYYCHELARGLGSESRNIYRWAGDKRTIDYKTHTRELTRDEIRDELASKVVESDEYNEIEKREDVERIVQERYPLLYELGLARTVPRRVWNHVRENDAEQLSRESRRSMENQRQGRRFEKFFERFCERNDLDYYRGSAGALRRFHPEKYGYVVEKLGGTRGIPDYFVRVDEGQESLGGSVWKPHADSFVEVKYNDSDLTREQVRMIPYLKSTGFEVYVLRGTPDDFFFERR
ncbi:MAG: hypothetical protein SXQ77_09665, partial [Halobacteria archaeon]|nr:hypothetical protein [Halobacteria archaeon]